MLQQRTQGHGRIWRQEMIAPTTPSDAALAQDLALFAIVADMRNRMIISGKPDAQIDAWADAIEATYSRNREADAGGGEWPARYCCNGPQGTFWIDNEALANTLIAATYDRDDWTVMDMHSPTGQPAN